MLLEAPPPTIDNRRPPKKAAAKQPLGVSDSVSHGDWSDPDMSDKSDTQNTVP